MRAAVLSSLTTLAAGETRGMVDFSQGLTTILSTNDFFSTSYAIPCGGGGGGGHIHLYKYYDDDKFHDDNNILIVTITMMENRRIMVTTMLAVR